MPSRKSFACDSMLGKLARWLRMAGFTTTYYEVIEDDDLIKACLAANAILVTRDRMLAEKAGNYVKTILIKSNSLPQQLREFISAARLKPRVLSPSLCTACGGELKRVLKKSVAGEVFPRVYERNKIFWRCTKCQKLYWKGTHLKGIKKVLGSIRSKN